MVSRQTERLTLTPVALREVVQYFELYQDPRVMRWIGPPAETIEQAMLALERMVGVWQERSWGMYSLYLREGGEFVGRCGLAPLDSSEAVELAYTLHQRFWGMGLSLEAAQEVLRFAFAETTITEVFAIALPENLASIRVMQKLKMTEVGIAKHYDREVVKYRILRSEFVPKELSA